MESLDSVCRRLIASGIISEDYKLGESETVNCRFHPDREGRIRCNKHEHNYCEECVSSCSACADPALYCRHRDQCIIWELCRKEIKRRKREAENTEHSE